MFLFYHCVKWDVNSEWQIGRNCTLKNDLARWGIIKKEFAPFFLNCPNEKEI